MIGNPPLLGGKLLIGRLGEDYVSRIFAVWQGRVPPEVDLVSSPLICVTVVSCYNLRVAKPHSR